MLPLKWKIFRIINYIYLVISLGLIGRIIWLSRGAPNSGFNNLSLPVIILCLLLLAANCSINVIKIEKHYPANYSSTIKKVSLTFLIFFGIIMSFVAFAFFHFLVEFINAMEDRNQNLISEDLSVVISLFVMISLGAYIFFMQIALAKTIRRNFENAMDNFLKN